MKHSMLFLGAALLLAASAPAEQATPPPPGGQAGGAYTEEKRAATITKLDQEIEKAEALADENQAWDLGFKITIVLLGVAGAIGAAIVARQSAEKPAPSWLPIAVAASSAIIAAVTTFSSTQMNFASRHALYRKKAATLRTLQSQLRDIEPPPPASEFNLAIGTVILWNDSTSPDVDPPWLKPKKS